MLECAEARLCVEGAVQLGGDLAAVVDVHVEAVAAAGRRLAARQREPYALESCLTPTGEKAAPAAAEIDELLAGLQLQAVEDQLVLALLRFREA